MRGSTGLIAMLMMTTAPSWAQDSTGIAVDPDLQQLPPPPSTKLVQRAGETAKSSSGQVGVRQTRAEVNNANPIARINNRIQNRVPARVRNRIDGNYDPHANAMSPFKVAEQETQRASRRKRR